MFDRARRRPPRLTPQILSLEGRLLLSADVRSIDGTGNNLAHLDWGAAGTDLLRLAAASYADGVSAPGGTARPGARVVSNAVADQGGRT